MLMCSRPKQLNNAVRFETYRAEHLQILESDFSGVQTKNKKKQTTIKVEVKVKRSKKIIWQNLGLETQRKGWFYFYIETKWGTRWLDIDVAI